MGAGEGKTFHEYVVWVGEDFFRSHLAGANAADTDKWKQTKANVYLWRPGGAGEQEYDFNPYFPQCDRVRVDRKEGYLFAQYEHRGGTGEFEPFCDEDDE